MPQENSGKDISSLFYSILESSGSVQVPDNESSHQLDDLPLTMCLLVFLGMNAFFIPRIFRWAVALLNSKPLTSQQPRHYQDFTNHFLVMRANQKNICRFSTPTVWWKNGICTLPTSHRAKVASVQSNRVLISLSTRTVAGCQQHKRSVASTAERRLEAILSGPALDVYVYIWICLYYIVQYKNV